MGKYFCLQCKRLLRLLALAVPTMAVLLACLGLAGATVIRQQQSSEIWKEFPIGLVGVPESGMLRIGLSAIDSFDDLGMAVELIELTEAEAPTALAEGRVRAYVVIPEGFVREASRGNLLTIQFITTPDPSGMVALFQQEVTDIIGDVLLQSEQATFGAYAALQPHIGHDSANQVINDLSTEFAEYIFLRNRTSVTVELGVDGAPDLATYLACGLGVTLVLLAGLCFAPITVQQHLGVSQMLCARGHSGLAQVLLDYAILALGALLTLGLLYLPACLLIPGLEPNLFFQAIPSVLVTAAIGYLCFSLASELHSGLLLYFFTAVALALAGGCLYPAWFFPERVQRLAAYLPTAVARRHLTGCVTGNVSAAALWGCAGYILVFVCLGAALRLRRIRRGKEASL